MFADIYIYTGLFVVAFLAATLFPAHSEAVLVGLLLVGNQPVWLLVAVATVGNTLGAAINWLLGRYFYLLRNKKWYPVKAETLEKAERWYHKYGRWSLLLSWVPFLGHPITLLAGVLREPFLSYMGIVGVAKLARYLVLAWLTLSLFQ